MPVHGATVIEKHFTLSRAEGGVDSAFSLEPHELRSLVVETERAWHSLGRVVYGGVKSEEKSKIFKRSVYVVKNMKVGDVFTESNLKIIRPGLGLSPKYFDIFLGRKINKDVKKGLPLSWDLID